MARLLIILLLLALIKADVVVDNNAATAADAVDCGRDGNDPCLTLAGGLAAAEANDRVLLRQGVYVENSSIVVEGMVKPVSIFGEGNPTIRRGSETMLTSALIEVRDANENTTIEGVTLEGASTTALEIVGGSQQVKGVIFRGNKPVEMERGGAVFLAPAGEDDVYQFIDCLFDDNAVSMNGGAISMGLLLGNGATLVVERCNFTGNIAEREGGAVYVSALRALNISYCQFRYL